ncbi:ankyrin repeat and BTB/POZ domain-containing protein 1-like [Xenia sp. Carnegie-2017]|uniref:ankyrin repeat and BTB/POZ domain-containing protein 1-like n=1 Tax=Xenia sp. Carnegie-2017 TaxID=2897299 RepID=UPI001F0356CB|nr:ankyrin repeat and BTB/POZ domain-containing protein 1-like [Xenia sp. Carnegie-2017]
MTSYLDQTYNNMDVAELFRCCRSGDIEKLRYLIDVKDVELNVRDFWDSTPLYYACLCGHEDMVELLLKSGSRCEANTFDGERCLYGALTDEIRRILEKYNAVNSDCMRRESYYEFLRRCFEQGAFADVHFVVQEDTVPAHRVILSARSLYLAEMFNTKWKEDTVFLPKQLFNSGQFRNMLKYFYTGKLDVPFQECDAYLYLASLFQLDELKKLIETRVENAKTFGESKRGFVRVTMICIDPSMERRNLKEEFTKLAEVALPDPFRFQQLPEMSLFISQMLGDNENALDDLSTLSDVCFHVEDFEFHCNKVFFYHRSHYFKALFDFSNTATAADQRRNLTGNYSINIRDLTPDIFAVVVAYMYTDDAKIPSDFEGIFNVICAAEMYLLPGLKRLCINSMIEILDVTNVVQAVRVSRTFSSPRLEAECCCYIAEYMDELANDQSLIELILEDARGIEERQETDSIPLVDDIRSHLYSSLLPNYSSENPTSSSEQRLEALEHMLRNIGLEC